MVTQFEAHTTIATMNIGMPSLWRNWGYPKLRLRNRRIREVVGPRLNSWERVWSYIAITVRFWSGLIIMQTYSFRYA